MCSPRIAGRVRDAPEVGWIWAADNGCYNDGWSLQGWYDWLERPRPRPGCLFATVPDVVGDAVATEALWREHRQLVEDLHYPVAFVAQDGLERLRVPWEQLDCLFVGGTTEWKQSEAAFAIAAEARARGKWVHVGRVNGGGRYRAWGPFADSCDGTFLRFGPSVNLPRLMRWLEHHEAEPQLWEQP